MYEKVLFVCGYPLMHNSSVTFQNRLIIKGLKKLGFVVDVVCPEAEKASPVYDESLMDIMGYVNQIYYIPLNKLYKNLLRTFSTKKHLNMSTHLISTSDIKSIRSMVRKVVRKCFADFLNFIDLDGSIRLSLSWKSLEDLKQNISEYKLLISSSDPKCAHLIAWKLLRYSKGRKPYWIQYWGDPWFDDVTLRGNWKRLIVYFMEKRLLKVADKVVYTSPITLKRQISLFSKYANKMSYANQASEENLINSKGNNTKSTNLVVGYFGDYNSRIRNILPFYRASDFFENIRFLVVGVGDVKLKNKDNFEIINKRLEFKLIKKLEQETQILFAVCNKQGTQIPAKIYYWAGYRDKPIVVAVDGEYKNDIREFLESFGRYIICENTVESIVEGIKKAVQNWKSGVIYDIPYELTCEGMIEKIIERI